MSITPDVSVALTITITTVSLFLPGASPQKESWISRRSNTRRPSLRPLETENIPRSAMSFRWWYARGITTNTSLSVPITCFRSNRSIYAICVSQHPALKAFTGCGRRADLKCVVQSAECRFDANPLSPTQHSISGLPPGSSRAVLALRSHPQVAEHPPPQPAPRYLPRQNRPDPRICTCSTATHPLLPVSRLFIAVNRAAYPLVVHHAKFP